MDSTIIKLGVDIDMVSHLIILIDFRAGRLHKISNLPSDRSSLPEFSSTLFAAYDKQVPCGKFKTQKSARLVAALDRFKPLPKSDKL